MRLRVQRLSFLWGLAAACSWAVFGGAVDSVSFTLPSIPTRTVPRGGGGGQGYGLPNYQKTTKRGLAESLATEEETLSRSTTEKDIHDETSTISSKSIKEEVATTTRILADDPEFVKPKRDLRQYRIIVLPNNLKVLLVSNSQKADDDDDSSSIGVEAASVHVQAGHFDDTLPGLAHFHEHMVFLGTEKYPLEDEFEAFFSQNGGFSNAYTDMEDTTYFFSVTTDPGNDKNQTTIGLAGGLDRLAQFFIKPNFEPNATDRELRAIDSEYRNALTSDVWRNYQLLKSTCNEQHPFSKFGCGNYKTLSSKGLDLLANELQTFWDTYYQTYNLRLAVVGHASLDALQRTVEETFGELPYSNQPSRHDKSNSNQFFTRENAVYGVRAYGPDQLGLIRKVVPFTESRSIKLYFATPPLTDPKVRDSKPYRVLSHLLGHESPGSLHALLNEEGYLEGLTSGVTIDTSDFSLFTLTLSLTPIGMKNYQTVLDLIFQWISVIREHTTDKELMSKYHEELQQMSKVNFQFRENGDPADFATAASELLFYDDYHPSRILVESVEPSDYDINIATEFLNRIKPENCMIHIVSSDLKEKDDDEKWNIEPWYGAKSQVEPISAEQMEQWEKPTSIDNRLRLPALNKYIPTDFSLRCDDDDNNNKEDEESIELSSKTNNDVDDDEIKEKENVNRSPPIPLINRPDFRLWHKMDETWRMPKAFVRLSLLSPDVYQSPRSMTYNRIFQRVLNDDLNSFVYDASLAGCSYRVSCTPDGYRISVSGYSEKLPFLLDTLTTRIISLIEELEEGKNPALLQKFEKAKTGLLRETKNYRLDTPYEVASYNSRLLIEQNVWYLDNYVGEMEGEEAERNPLTMEECARVAKQSLMGRVRGEALCMGNIDRDGAKQVADVIDSHFLQPSRTLTEVEIPRFRSLKIPNREEAIQIFGEDAFQDRSIPLIYQELSFSETEENNAVEIILQCGSELELGYKGTAFLDLLGHIAYNSAYNQLRTQEQLGYIVSVFARTTAGSSWGLSIVVQGSAFPPQTLEKRCEAWLASFRKELDAMSPDEIAVEAAAVAAQLLERETKLSQEVRRAWVEILGTEELSDRMRTPTFDRLSKLASQLTISSADDSDDNNGKLGSSQELKDQLLEFFDKHIDASSPHRRVMSSRVFSQKTAKADYESYLGQPGVLSTFADMRHLKQFLSTYPTVPYWGLNK